MLRFAIIAAASTLVASSPALGKGGYIRRSEPIPMELTTGSLPQAPPLYNFGGCGRGRYRDPGTHKCRGPADFGDRSLTELAAFKPPHFPNEHHPRGAGLE